MACEGEIISLPVTFEYRAREEGRGGGRAEEEEEQRLEEEGLVRRLEHLGLLRGEERERLVAARKRGQVQKQSAKGLPLFCSLKKKSQNLIM